MLSIIFLRALSFSGKPPVYPVWKVGNSIVDTQSSRFCTFPCRDGAAIEFPKERYCVFTRRKFLQISPTNSYTVQNSTRVVIARQISPKFHFELENVSHTHTEKHANWRRSCESSSRIDKITFVGNRKNSCDNRIYVNLTLKLQLKPPVMHSALSKIVATEEVTFWQVICLQDLRSFFSANFNGGTFANCCVRRKLGLLETARITKVTNYRKTRVTLFNDFRPERKLAATITDANSIESLLMK